MKLAYYIQCLGRAVLAKSADIAENCPPRGMEAPAGGTSVGDVINLEPITTIEDSIRTAGRH